MPNRHIPTNEMETIKAELLELSFKTFQQPHNSRSGTPFNSPFDDFATLNATPLHDLGRNTASLSRIFGTDNSNEKDSCSDLNTDCNNKNQKENIIQGEKSSLSTENLNPTKWIKEQVPKNETESITSCVYVEPHRNPFINTNSFDSMLDDAEKINTQSLEDLVTNSDEFYGTNYSSEEVLYNEENTIQEQGEESSLSTENLNQKKSIKKQAPCIEPRLNSFISTNSFDRMCDDAEKFNAPLHDLVANSDEFNRTNYSTEELLDNDEGNIVDGDNEGINDDDENEVVDDEKEDKADDDGDDGDDEYQADEDGKDYDDEDDETDGGDENDYYNEEDYDDEDEDDTDIDDDTDVEDDEGYEDGTGEDSCSDFEVRIYDNLVETNEYE